MGNFQIPSYKTLPKYCFFLRNNCYFLLSYSCKSFIEIICVFPNLFLWESDHWLCLSLTNSLTNSCLVNLINVTLAWEEANSKLVEVVTVTVVENRVGNNLLQIWKLRYGYKAKLLFKLSAQGLVRSLKLKFRRVWSVCHCWCLVEVTKLNLGQDYEAMFGQDFKFTFSRDADVWDFKVNACSRFRNWNLIKIWV